MCLKSSFGPWPATPASLRLSVQLVYPSTHRFCSDGDDDGDGDDGDGGDDDGDDDDDGDGDGDDDERWWW